MVRLFVSCVITAFLLFSIGCNTTSTEGVITQVIEICDTVRDTIDHADVTKFPMIVGRDTLTINDLYTRFTIKGTKFIDTIIDSTHTVEYSTIDTILKRKFIIVLPSGLTDTAFKSDTVKSKTKINEKAPVTKKDTVLNIRAVLDTLFSLFCVATTADSKTGNLSVVGAGGNFPVKKNTLPVHADSRIQTYHGYTYILGRLGADNIIKMKGGTLTSDSIVYQKSMGTAVNLRDIAFVSDVKAYVTQYNSTKLLVINPSTGDKISEIDLSAFNTNAGTDSAQLYPFMEQSVVIGSKVYVLCQRLKVVGSVLTPSIQPGIIAVINTSTDQVIKGIELTNKNPVSMDTAAGFLYVSSMNTYQSSLDGALEKVDCSLDTCLGSIISESQFGGNVGKVLMISSRQGYMCVTKNATDTTRSTTVLVEFNPKTQTVGASISGINHATGGIAYDGYYLFIGDCSKTTPGIFVLNPSDNSMIKGPLSLGLSPTSISILSLSSSRFSTRKRITVGEGRLF